MTILPDVDGWTAASSCSRTLLRTRFFVGGGVGVFDLGAVFFFCVCTGLDPFIVASADFLLRAVGPVARTMVKQAASKPDSKSCDAPWFGYIANFRVNFTQMDTLDVILSSYTTRTSQESVFLHQYELETRFPLEIHKISKLPNTIKIRSCCHYFCKPL